MHCSKYFFTCPKSRETGITCQSHPARTCQSRYLNPDLSGFQIYSLTHYADTKEVISKEGRARQEKEGVANCKHLYFPKAWFIRLKTIRITEVECWTTREPKKESQRIPLTDVRKSAFSPGTGKIWTKKNNEAVAWKKSDSSRRCLPEDSQWGHKLSNKHVLYVYCVPVAKPLPWLWSLASKCWREITKPKWRREPCIENHERAWAGLIEATPGMLALSVPQLSWAPLSLRPSNQTPSLVVI